MPPRVSEVKEYVGKIVLIQFKNGEKRVGILIDNNLSNQAGYEMLCKNCFHLRNQFVYKPNDLRYFNNTFIRDNTNLSFRPSHIKTIKEHSPIEDRIKLEKEVNK